MRNARTIRAVTLHLSEADLALAERIVARYNLTSNERPRRRDELLLSLLRYALAKAAVEAGVNVGLVEQGGDA